MVTKGTALHIPSSAVQLGRVCVGKREVQYILRQESTENINNKPNFFPPVQKSLFLNQGMRAWF